MNEISKGQIITASEALGIDPALTTEVHIVVRDGGVDLTVVQHALNEFGKPYFDPDNMNQLAKVTTAMRIEEA